MLNVVVLFLLGTALQDPAVDDSAAHPLWIVDDFKLRTFWEKGFRAGQKGKGDAEKLLDYLRTDIGTVRSPAGEKWRASYVIPLPPIAKMEVAGFETGKRLENFETEGKSAIAEEVKNRNDVERTISFEVGLNAWPSIGNAYEPVKRKANPKDVKATDFILLVDGRKVRLKDSEKTDQGSAGGSVNGWIRETTDVKTGRHKHSTVAYNTVNSVGYEAYTATYRLEFPFFDPDGKPYITTASRQLMLRIVMPSGIREVKIDLGKMMDRADKA